LLLDIEYTRLVCLTYLMLDIRVPKLIFARYTVVMNRPNAR